MSEFEITREELENKLLKSVNKTLGEVDIANVFGRSKGGNKGIAGAVIEQSVIGYPANSDQKPDLLVDGTPTEVKTTGIRYGRKARKRKKQKNKDFEAKEPMSITAVSPKKIVNEEFESSNFWHKLAHMLLVYYHYDVDGAVSSDEYRDFLIKGYDIRDMPKEDTEILKNDWKLVYNYIKQQFDKELSPEELNESLLEMTSILRKDLMYIDLAPKKSARFRLKRSYVTSMVQEFFDCRYEDMASKITNSNDIREILKENSYKYTGKTIREIRDSLGLKSKGKTPKSIGEQIVAAMFGSPSTKSSKIPVFQKANITVKTIKITESKKRTEDTKLERLHFDELLENKEFEESPFYNCFAEKSFIFVLFEENGSSKDLLDSKFLGFKWLSFDDNFLEGPVRTAWEHTYNLVVNNQLVETYLKDKHGNLIKNKSGAYRTQLNFIKSKDNAVFLRGTGRDSFDKTEVVNGINMYQQSIWIKGSELTNMLNSLPFI